MLNQFRANTPPTGEEGIFFQKSAQLNIPFGGVLETTDSVRTVCYEIQSRDGAILMAKGLSTKSKVKVEPEDVILHNPRIFNFIRDEHGGDPFDLNHEQHKRLPAGPNDKIKHACVEVWERTVKVYRPVREPEKFVTFMYKGELHGAMIDLNVFGFVDGELLVATGFDNWAKAAFGLRIHGHAGTSFSTYRKTSHPTAARLDFVFFGEFAKTIQKGEISLLNSDDVESGSLSGSSTLPVYNDGFNARKKDGQLDFGDLNSQGPKKNDYDAGGGINPVFEYKRDTTVVHLNGWIGASGERNWKVHPAIPAAALRVEFNGKIGGKVDFIIKVFKLNDYEPKIFLKEELVSTRTLGVVKPIIYLDGIKYLDGSNFTRLD